MSDDGDVCRADHQRSTETQDFQPLRRRGRQRLAHEQWGSGRSIWAADAEGRSWSVDSVTVTEEGAADDIAAVLGMSPGQPVLVRSRRYVLDGRPVMLATSYLPADLVAGSAIAEQDTGPGGTYSRLAELGFEPVHVREEVRCRMPGSDEASRLALAAGTPVILVCRTAFTAEHRPVEVNRMTLDSGSYVLEFDFDL